MRPLRLLLFVGMLFACMATARAQSNPVKLATGTRFDLFAAAAVGAIDNGVVVKGSGSMSRMTWIDAGEQARSYTCRFSAVHFGWLELGVQFTPANSGTVDITLMGPWEESPGGPIFRQEVLWDALSATNATLLNGSFESVSNGVPDNWSRPYGDAAVETGPLAAPDGTRYVRTWHNGPLRQTIGVTGGRTVTLRFFSRLRLPDGYVDMARLPGSGTPAHQARLKFMRGTNLGNYLEAAAGQNWGLTYSDVDFERIRAEGFDHVRIPVRWNDHTGPAPGYTITESFAEKVDAMIAGARAHGLAVIVNIHHFDEFMADPPGQTEKFHKIWEQIAARYSGEPESVAFELLNEPTALATTEALNPIYQEAITRIRITNPNRTLFVGPGNYNRIGELAALRLPTGDSNIIATVHGYAPFLFTHQGATWTGEATATTGIRYPGPPDVPISAAPAAAGIPWVVDWIKLYNTVAQPYNPCGKAAFEENLALARMWSDYYGRPVHLGEFGCYERADADSRSRFYRDMREAMDRLGIGWATWDWKAGFKYWDSPKNQPASGMRESLFALPAARMTEPGRLQFDAAIGKTYRVLRSTDLQNSAGWELLSTETLSSPDFDYLDPSPPPNLGFYRAEWVK